MGKLLIYTSRVGCEDKDAIDISVKSGVMIFAPTWEMVMGIKYGTMLSTEYEKRYRSLMDFSYKMYDKLWHRYILDKERIVLCCYCAPKTFCHRYILRDFIIEKCKELGIEVEYVGEIAA